LHVFVVVEHRIEFTAEVFDFFLEGADLPVFLEVGGGGCCDLVLYGLGVFLHLGYLVLEALLLLGEGGSDILDGGLELCDFVGCLGQFLGGEAVV
jgi:hypothetical protein